MQGKIIENEYSNKFKDAIMYINGINKGIFHILFKNYYLFYLSKILEKSKKTQEPPKNKKTGFFSPIFSRKSKIAPLTNKKNTVEEAKNKATVEEAKNEATDFAIDDAVRHFTYRSHRGTIRLPDENLIFTSEIINSLSEAIKKLNSTKQFLNDNYQYKERETIKNILEKDEITEDEFNTLGGNYQGYYKVKEKVPISKNEERYRIELYHVAPAQGVSLINKPAYIIIDDQARSGANAVIARIWPEQEYTGEWLKKYNSDEKIKTKSDEKIKTKIFADLPKDLHGGSRKTRKGRSRKTRSRKGRSRKGRK